MPLARAPDVLGIDTSLPSLRMATKFLGCKNHSPGWLWTQHTWVFGIGPSI